MAARSMRRTRSSRSRGARLLQGATAHFLRVGPHTMLTAAFIV